MNCVLGKKEENTEPQKFNYTVINDEMYSNPLTYTSRRYAELAAIEHAFKLLEDL